MFIPRRVFSWASGKTGRKALVAQKPKGQGRSALEAIDVELGAERPHDEQVLLKHYSLNSSAITFCVLTKEIWGPDSFPVSCLGLSEAHAVRRTRRPSYQ